MSTVTWSPLEAAYDDEDEQWYVLLYRVRETTAGDRLNVTGGAEL
jgi:hypothetical protein